MKRWILLLFVLVIFGGCAATPPGKLTDEDFVIKQVTINSTVSEAHASLMEGFRH
jgi:hypothetical protein